MKIPFLDSLRCYCICAFLDRLFPKYLQMHGLSLHIKAAKLYLKSEALMTILNPAVIYVSAGKIFFVTKQPI